MSQSLIADSYGHKREEFAKALIKAARSSIGTNSPAKEMIIKQKIRFLLHQEEALQEITDMLMEMARKLMEEDINIMTSIKGIGDKTAANFLVEMGGDINKFECSGKIIAMAGLDPAVYQSGKHEGKRQDNETGQPSFAEDHLDDDNQCDPIHRYFSCLLSQTKKGGIALQEGCISHCS